MRDEKEVEALIAEIKEDLREKGYPDPETTDNVEWESLAIQKDDEDAVLQKTILDHLLWCLGKDFIAVRQFREKLKKQQEEV